MSYGDVRSGQADLKSLFGQLDAAETEALLAELGQIDRLLEQLAEEASSFVEFAYSHSGLNVAGSLSGGAFSNDAGDLWFEIHRPQEDQELTRWEVTARIIVFCDLELGGQTRGGSCTHDLLDLETHAFSPAQAIAMLSEHVETVARDLRLRSPDEFRGLRHDQLPA